MTDGIRSVRVLSLRSTPAEAEVLLRVTPERPASGQALAGRVVGPRCEYVSTIEVAYPLREVRSERGEDGSLVARAIIPEPNLWEPARPFGYQVFLNLVEQGGSIGQRSSWVGFRDVALGARLPLSLNGSQFTIRAVWRTGRRDASIERYRASRYNTIFPTTLDDAARIATSADRFGLFLLPILDQIPEIEAWQRLRAHASYLGLVLPPAVFAKLVDLPAAPQPELGFGTLATHSKGAVGRFVILDQRQSAAPQSDLPAIMRIDDNVSDGEGPPAPPGMRLIGYWTPDPFTADGASEGRE